MFRRSGFLALCLLLGACQAPTIVNSAFRKSGDASGRILVETGVEQKYPGLYAGVPGVNVEAGQAGALNVRLALLDLAEGAVIYDAPITPDGNFAVSLPEPQAKREVRALFFAFVDTNQNRRFDHGEPRSDNRYELLWEGDSFIGDLNGWSRLEIVIEKDGNQVKSLSPLSTPYEFSFK